jgi:hypothetical protein
MFGGLRDLSTDDKALFSTVLFSFLSISFSLKLTTAEGDDTASRAVRVGQ